MVRTVSSPAPCAAAAVSAAAAANARTPPAPMSESVAQPGDSGHSGGFSPSWPKAQFSLFLRPVGYARAQLPAARSVARSGAHHSLRPGHRRPHGRQPLGAAAISQPAAVGHDDRSRHLAADDPAAAPIRRTARRRGRGDDGGAPAGPLRPALSGGGDAARAVRPDRGAGARGFHPPLAAASALGGERSAHRRETVPALAGALRARTGGAERKALAVSQGRGGLVRGAGGK